MKGKEKGAGMEKDANIKQLIEKMKTEKLNCAVLELWYGDFKHNIERCFQIHNSGSDYACSRYYKNADVLYENLDGFLQALFALNYIDMQLLKKCNDELQSFFDF